MAKYHFEIVDRYKIEDRVGLDCKSESQAQQVAQNIAKQILIDVGPNAARKVVVVDDAGVKFTRPRSRTPDTFPQVASHGRSSDVQLGNVAPAGAVETYRRF